MNFKLTDLKDFKEKSAFIKQNSIIPVLSNILFTKGKLIKNNLKEFIVYQLENDIETLIDERILMNYISTAKGDVQITHKAKKVTITDGSIPVTSTAGNVEEYPITSLSDATFTALPEGTLDAIAMAVKFINPNVDGYASFVFCGKGMVAASDGFIGSITTIDTPTIILSKECALAVCGLDAPEFAESDNYYFFRSENITYGFIKPEQQFIDFTPFLTYPDEKSFTLAKSELIRFNDVCVNSGQSKALSAKFAKVNGHLVMTMNDTDYAVDAGAKVVASGSEVDEFKYSPALMNRLLKALPEQELTFIEGKHKYYIKGQLNYLTLIMEMV